MKVLAINGSPQMDKGNTALILNPFLEGMQQAGAEVEVLYTKKLKVNPCLADFGCILKTPGRCIQNDDMKEIYPKVREADIWILASPLFWDGLSGPLKCLVDRLTPLGSAPMEIRDGHTRHPVGPGAKGGKIVLVSNCGFWELDNFDPILAHVKAICRNAGREFGGALLRPHGPIFGGMVKMGMPVGDIFEAAKEAGRQLIQNGEMSAETLAIVSRPLQPLDQFVEGYNQRIAAYFQTQSGS
ncbi:MAG: flavodoxin family protein [Chloroflexi bacterium]|nr:flavodoxin family protein [Chloroflexota bacterium]